MAQKSKMNTQRVEFTISDEKGATIYRRKPYVTTVSDTQSELVFPGTEHTSDYEDDLHKDISLLQDIAFELPEIENRLVNSMCSMQQNSTAVPTRRFLDIIGPFLYFSMICGVVFAVGLIIGSFISCSTGLSGTLMQYYTIPKPKINFSLHVAQHSTEKDVLTIEGVFGATYYVYNKAPFAATQSAFVSVYYLPKADNSKLTRESCFGDLFGIKREYSRKKVDNLKEGAINSLFSRDGTIRDPGCGAIKFTESGSLVNLKKAISHEGAEDIGHLKIIDSSIYDIFSSYILACNKIHIIPTIQNGFNEVRLLTTIKSRISKSEDAFFAKRLLSDCKNGYLTLRFIFSAQSFDSMFFGGNMAPTKFFPMQVPCVTSVTEEDIKAFKEVMQKQVDKFKTRHNTLYRLGTLPGSTCSI